MLGSKPMNRTNTTNRLPKRGIEMNDPDESTSSSQKAATLLRKLVQGHPVELTDASEETNHVRDLLEREDPFNLDGHEYDPNRCVFWNKDKSMVLLNFW